MVWQCNGMAEQWCGMQWCWRPAISPQQIIDRFGLAPGAGLAAHLKAPLLRRLCYGAFDFGFSSESSLVPQISRHVSHNGSDVSISLGIPFSSKMGNHVSSVPPGGAGEFFSLPNGSSLPILMPLS